MTKDKQLEQLQRSLNITNHYLERWVSYKHGFFLSIVKGVGYALGATLVAGVAVTLLINIFQTVMLFPAAVQYFEDVGSSAESIESRR